jgi:hypothetical protein
MSRWVLTAYQGLIDAEERHGFEGDGFSYLKSPIWWAGIIARTRPGIPRTPICG